MNGITWIHIAGGTVALAAGTLALGLRKGSSLHKAAGTAFCVGMFVLGLSASLLAPMKTPAESPLGGLMVCYFVATAWLAARRRTGPPIWVERGACAFILFLAVAIIAKAFELSALPVGTPMAPPGPIGLFILGGLCLLAGIGDLRYLLGASLTHTQRLTRHLWRMCFSFFMATGSFFLGQQDALPQAMRGEPYLFALAFAPFGLMLFWLIRVRFMGRPSSAIRTLPVSER